MRRPLDDPGARWRPLARRLAIATALLAGMLASAPGSSLAEETAPPEHARRPRPSGVAWPGREGSSGAGGWTGTAFVALMLAACGGLAVAARRLGPRAPGGAVQVVGRVSLSPRHSVYLLRVGRRTLLVGAGPQGPPALIADLEDVPQDPPISQQGAES